MDPSVYNTWKRITNSAISTNGEWVTYGLEVERGDKTLKLYHSQTGEEHTFDRAEDAQIDYENHALYFIIKPAEDSIRHMKRMGVDKAQLPGDTLGMFNLRTKTLSKLPNVKSYKIPEEWGGMVAVLLLSLIHI